MVGRGDSESILSLVGRIFQYNRLIFLFIIINFLAANIVVVFYQREAISSFRGLGQIVVVRCTNATHQHSQSHQQPSQFHQQLEIEYKGNQNRPKLSPSVESIKLQQLSLDEAPEMELTESSAAPVVPRQATTVLPRPFERFHLDTKNTCAGKVDVIICVHTHPSGYAWRRLIRQTWANQTFWANTTVKVVFFTGLVSINKTSLQAALEEESRTWGDIVQGDFIDTYRNLSLKAMTVLQWIKERCSNASYFFKADDDIAVNVFSLRQILVSTGIKPGEIVCNTFRNITVKRSGKWAITYEELPRNDSYPAFCAGMGYIMRVSTALALRAAYDSLDPFWFFWVDDIYVTGYLAKAINAKHVPINTRVLWGQNKIKSQMTGSRWRAYIMGHARNLQLVNLVWSKILHLSQQKAPIPQIKLVKRPVAKVIPPPPPSLLIGRTASNVTRKLTEASTTPAAATAAAAAAAAVVKMPVGDVSAKIQMKGVN